MPDSLCFVDEWRSRWNGEGRTKDPLAPSSCLLDPTSVLLHKVFLLSCAVQEMGLVQISAWALSSDTIFHDFKSFSSPYSFLWAIHCYTAIVSCLRRCEIPCAVPAGRNDRGVNKMSCRLWKQKTSKKSNCTLKPWTTAGTFETCCAKRCWKVPPEPSLH